MKRALFLTAQTLLYLGNHAQSHIRCQSVIFGKCGDSLRPSELNCCDYGYCQPWKAEYYQCIDKPARCSIQHTDKDLHGNDLETLYGLQPNECCTKCASTKGCVAYTFINENPDEKALVI
uniref:Cellulose binding elicitor lectin (CBEL) putative n=1 Tax=Albugo laibachii Nc14 TaxID=890382 RepID=F0WDJ9_9STRA|nr:cellulose binding elicitor lectin (CBEL) putative [Albugo laibachii Nc14]|eukprot:CCA19273.1 cellulose binding elicitor lectin (CBEL) putative [Albugo laibachii Nc14]